VWTISIVNGIAYGSLLFLLAAGFSMIFGVLKVINLAHGSLYLGAAYVAFSLVEAGTGMVVAISVAIALTALVAALSERFLLYRLQGQYLAQVLVTIGLLHIFADVFHLVWGGTPRVMQTPELWDWSVPMGVMSYPAYRLFLIGCGLAVALALWYLLERTRLGSMVRAAVDDEEMAQTSGVVVPKLRWIVFGLGGLLAGLAGGLGAPFLGARPGLDLEVFLLALVVVVVGGIGSLWGAYLAAMLVGVIDSVGKILLPEASMFMLFLPLLLILLFRPSGLSGRVLTQIVTLSRDSSGSTEPAGLVARLRPWVARIRETPSWVVALGLLLLLILLPVIASSYSLGIITLILIWGIVGLGFNVLLGYAGMPSFGHAAFFGGGAYAVALLSNQWQGSAWLLLLMATLCMAIMAVAFALIALRTRLVYFLLATVALGQLAWGVVFKWRSFSGGDDGLRFGGKLTLGSLNAGGDRSSFYYAVALIFLVICVGFYRLHRSRFKLVLEGLQGNEQRLAALGYDTWIYRFGAFVLSGTVAGLAGGLFAFHAGFVSPQLLGIVVSAKIMLITILGGAGTFIGPLLGALVLIGAEELVTRWTPYWESVQGVLFIVVAVLAPRGLAGAFNRYFPSSNGKGH